jgi:hypothetical protein
LSASETIKIVVLMQSNHAHQIRFLSSYLLTRICRIFTISRHQKYSSIKLLFNKKNGVNTALA